MFERSVLAGEAASPATVTDLSVIRLAIRFPSERKGAAMAGGALCSFAVAFC